MCSFVPALTPSCAPICCGACNCTNPSASKQQPGKRARGCWWDQYTCREEGWLGPSPWKRPACQRPVDFSYGLYSDIEFLRLWGKPKHYYSVMISLHLLSLSPYWFNSEPFLPSSLTPFFFLQEHPLFHDVPSLVTFLRCPLNQCYRWTCYGTSLPDTKVVCCA